MALFEGLHMTVRPAAATDADVLAGLVETTFNACVAPEYSAEGTTFFLLISNDLYFKKRIKEQALILVAESGTEIIGMIEIRDTNHIARFFVLPGYQRQGVGRALFNTALTACRERLADMHEFTVHASPNAVPAYERLGFTVSDTEQIANGMRYISMRMIIKTDA